MAINLMWNLSYIEAQDLCKHQIDSMEHWSRRIINEKFTEKYGEDFFNFRCEDGTPLIKKEICNKVEGRFKSTPLSYPRKVDALTIEDLEYFFCKDCFYNGLFKGVFEPFFSGSEELKRVLKKVSSVRNKIAHGNPLSQRDVEQGVCYSNDLIDVFKDYYMRTGKEKIYNVPTFISITDSFGRSLIRDNSNYSWEVYEYMFEDNNQNKQPFHLYSGNSYRVIIEVDSSFPEDFYTIEWIVNCGYTNVLAQGKGNIVEFSVDDSTVSFRPEIIAKLITNRSWHRFGNQGCDDYLEFHMDEVYPDIGNDSYQLQIIKH